MIDVELVLTIHDHILANEKGLKGGVDLAKLESALSRIDNYAVYQEMNNIFDIAALYAVAIAKAHAFSDGNKRTAMVTMLTYLDLQGVEIMPDHGLDDVMVKIASSEWGVEQLSVYLQQYII